MTLIADLTDRLTPAHVLTGPDAARYGTEWTGKYTWQPRAVLRPGSTAEVQAILRLAHETATPIVPVSGNTGLNGGTMAEGALMLSLERLNRITAINPVTKTATVQSGVILSKLHTAAAEHDLIFPLTFGARCSAMIGGCLSTNAGGSNVLRYGNARALCLGLEVVLADGRLLDLQSALHKDNTGLDLRDLMIGAEGTLGIITAATLKLFPRPLAYATALVALPSLAEALTLLNRLQSETGGAVEACEYMPRVYMERLAHQRPDLAQPFAPHEVTLLIELGATAACDAVPGEGGQPVIATLLETTLGDMLAEDTLLDAVIAQTEAQRGTFWAMREAAAEITLNRRPLVDTDIAVPLDAVQSFLTRMADRLAALDPGAEVMTVAHLGDGNIHYTAYPTRDDPEHLDAIRAAVEDVVSDLSGSFSAEHGIGLTKLPSMRRRKNAVALEVMRSVKAALDPRGILNPGKTIP